MITTYQRLKRHSGTSDFEGGFTMIEILIVIVVLGILAAVVIFALGGITGATAVASCQADGATVSTAIVAFNNQNSGVTVTQATLLTGTPANGMNPYIQSWPSNTPHYAFFLGDSNHGTIAGSLYVVTGALYVSAGTYTLTGGDAGSLTPTEVAAATTTGTTQAIPALIPYTSAICAAATTLVS